MLRFLDGKAALTLEYKRKTLSAKRKRGTPRVGAKGQFDQPPIQAYIAKTPYFNVSSNAPRSRFGLVLGKSATSKLAIRVSGGMHFNMNTYDAGSFIGEHYIRRCTKSPPRYHIVQANNYNSLFYGRLPVSRGGNLR